MAELNIAIGDDMVQVTVNPRGIFEAHYKDKQFKTESFAVMEAELRKHARVRRARVNVPVGTKHGTNYTLTGLHADERTVLVRNAEGKADKLEGWTVAYLPWDDASHATFTTLLKAQTEAAAAFGAFLRTRSYPLGRPGATVTVSFRDIVLTTIKQKIADAQAVEAVQQATTTDHASAE